MIKSSDLRIGNFIGADLSIDSENLFTVMEVGEDMKCIEGCFSIDSYNYKNNTTGYWNIGYFEPIPLTEQWLIDFDFIRQGNRKMWVKGNVCVILEDYPDLRGNSTGEKFYIGFKDLGNVIYHTQFEVPFVHTLQNAYALTGEELTKN